MADISIDERFGIEPLRCDDCGVTHPGHSPYCPQSGPGVPGGNAGQDHIAELERERDAAREAADQWAEAARTAQRDACMRGFSLARAAFEAWRDGDRGLGDLVEDPDVGLAVQSTLLGFQALARALAKK